MLPTDFVQVSLQKRGAAVLDSYELSEAFCAQRFSHTVILAQGNELAGSWRENEYRRLIWIKTYSGLGSFFLRTVSLFRPLAVSRMINSLEPRNVYFTHIHPWLFLIFPGVKAQKFLTLHENPFDPKEEFFLTASQKFLLRRAGVIVTHSEYLKTQLEDKVSGPVLALPLGSYERSAAGVIKSEVRGLKNILFFGRIRDYKGLEVLLKAYELIVQQNLPVRLTVAGNGELDAALRETMSRLGVDLQTRWFSLKETMRLFSETDLVVLPYLKASQSGVVSLAMALNRPVVASRIGGLPEQVWGGVNGLLVEPNSASDLAQKIGTLYNDPELLADLGVGNGIVKQKLSWNLAAQKIISYLESQNPQ